MCVSPLRKGRTMKHKKQRFKYLLWSDVTGPSNVRQIWETDRFIGVKLPYACLCAPCLSENDLTMVFNAKEAIEVCQVFLSYKHDRQLYDNKGSKIIGFSRWESWDPSSYLAISTLTKNLRHGCTRCGYGHERSRSRWREPLTCVFTGTTTQPRAFLQNLVTIPSGASLPPFFFLKKKKHEWERKKSSFWEAPGNMEEWVKILESAWERESSSQRLYVYVYVGRSSGW